MFESPRSYPAAKSTREQEPYSRQRQRAGLHSSYPRPAQANTSQPNQKELVGWGLSTQDYWNSVFRDYLNRKKLAQNTPLRMGREM